MLEKNYLLIAPLCPILGWGRLEIYGPTLRKTGWDGPSVNM
jgi:hypothetical protein